MSRSPRPNSLGPCDVPADRPKFLSGGLCGGNGRYRVNPYLQRAQFETVWLFICDRHHELLEREARRG